MDFVRITGEWFIYYVLITSAACSWADRAHPRAGGARNGTPLAPSESQPLVKKAAWPRGNGPADVIVCPVGVPAVANLSDPAGIVIAEAEASTRAPRGQRAERHSWYPEARTRDQTTPTGSVLLAERLASRWLDPVAEFGCADGHGRDCQDSCDDDVEEPG
jgi:hypothetical protein